MEPPVSPPAAPFLSSMAYTIHVRVDADLLGIARMIRLLRRYAVNAGEVAIERLSGREVASLQGTLALARSPDGLVAALVTAPDVLNAVVFSDTRIVVEFTRRLPQGSPR